MSVFAILKLLMELRKQVINVMLSQAFYCFLAISLMTSIMQKHNVVSMHHISLKLL